MKKVVVAIITLEAFKMYSILLSTARFPISVIANSADERPYVYRVLVPLLSRIAGYIFNDRPEKMIEFVFVLSAVLSFFTMKYFYESFYEDGTIAAFVSVQILFMICVIETKVYDYMTFALFSLSLAFMARGKHGAFLILFPIATLNRETTFLLIFFYAVWFFKKMPRAPYLSSLAYQVSVYLVEKIIVQSSFSNNGGMPVYFEFFQVISTYKMFWPALLVLVPLVYLIARSWNGVPEFVKTAALVFFPMQIILHLLFGKAFEVRVFAESIPILTMFIGLDCIFSRDRAGSLLPILRTRTSEIYNALAKRMVSKPDSHVPAENETSFR